MNQKHHLVVDLGARGDRRRFDRVLTSVSWFEDPAFAFERFSVGTAAPKLATPDRIDRCRVPSLVATWHW